MSVYLILECLLLYLSIITIQTIIVNYLISDSYGSNPVAVSVRNYYHLVGYFGSLLLILLVAIVCLILNIHQTYSIKILIIVIFLFIYQWYSIFN